MLFSRPSLGVTLVGPRDAIETELAGIWRELLGVREVGVDDDFFELGGESIVGVRMFQRIGRTFGVELPLATLFEAPTIAQLAAALRDRIGVSDEREDSVGKEVWRDQKGTVPNSLLRIRPGKGATPFFCVHGAGGHVLNLRDLAVAMDGAHPFYGLQARGVDGATPPHETLEQMAGAYVAEIRELQREGPYLLSGYSGGGLVAFEMARLLTGAGHDVKLLALIDTFHPLISPRPMTLRARAARLREEKLAYVAEVMARPRERLRKQTSLRRIDDHRSRGQALPLELRELHMTHHFDSAASRYRPKPWSGQVTLFRATEVAHIYRHAGAYCGWEHCVLGGLEVVSVGGNHATIVLGSNAAILACMLRARIARATSELRTIERTGIDRPEAACETSRGPAVESRSERHVRGGLVARPVVSAPVAGDG
jgi:thioesterase domain-containing protein/acyl carrier protein